MTSKKHQIHFGNSYCFFLIFCLVYGCKEKSNKLIINNTVLVYDSLYIADSFDFPVGKPDANGYYNAQEFKENLHLGDDWNAVTGGNTDIGDPVYSIANGYVRFAENHGGGWGNVIRIIHKMPNGKVIESVYAHCNSILVNENQWIEKGTKIGTIGTADGQYLAHLHFEIRDDYNLPIGTGYSSNTNGYIDPTEFITNNRLIVPN